MGCRNELHCRTSRCPKSLREDIRWTRWPHWILPAAKCAFVKKKAEPHPWRALLRCFPGGALFRASLLANPPDISPKAEDWRFGLAVSKTSGAT